MVDISEYVRQNSVGFIDDLRRVCRQPSISAQNKGMAECASLIRSMMEELSIETQLIPVKDAFPVVYGELKTEGATKSLLFYNHYDVQPPEPLEEWKSDPFGAEVTEGKIYGRGVADDKGDLVARLKAVETVQRAHGKVPVNLKFLVEGEEEIGSTHLESFVEEHRDLLSADACIWEGGSRDPSGRPELYFGMKGILYVELRAKTAQTDQHSMWAPIMPNPAWRIVWALKTLKDERQKILVKGFYDRVKPPTKTEIAALKKMAFGEDEYKKAFGIERFLDDASGLRLRKNLLFSPTCTVCGFESGYTGPGIKTVNPCRATAKIDFRLVPDQDPEDILRKLQTHLKMHGFEDLDVVRLNAEDPAKTSLKSRIATVVAETARRVYGYEPSIWPIVPGSGPMSLFTKKLKIPTASAGVGYYDCREHAPNENIRIEDYLLGIRHMAEVITSF